MSCYWPSSGDDWHFSTQTHTFVSDVFEGFISDVDIVKQSVLLEKLDKVDLMLPGS